MSRVESINIGNLALEELNDDDDEEEFLRSSPDSDFAPPAVKKRPSPSSDRPENITISDDRSAGSNLEARNLAALKSRDQITSKTKVKKKLAPYHTMGGSTSREMLAPGIVSVNPPSTHDVAMQKRFGQLRLGTEALTDTEILPGIHDILLDGTGNGRTPQKASKDQDESNEDDPETDPCDRLRTDIEKLQRKVARMQQILHKTEIEQQKKSKKRYQVLYRLDSRCYLDHPEWTQGQASIVSRRPLHNFELFLERNKNIVFVVYRDFVGETSKPRTGDVTTPPQHTKESVRMINKHLLAFFERLLEQDWRYADDLDRLRRTGELDAPYLFIYHHRRYWEQLLSHCSRTVREHLNLLTAYVFKNYGHEYMAADALFAKRKITVDFVKYLIQPGDTLVSQESGQYRGLVAKSWPLPIKETGLGTELKLPEEKDEYDSYGHGSTESDVDNLGIHNDSRLPEVRLNSISSIQHHTDEISKDRESNAPTKEIISTFGIDTWEWSFDGEFAKYDGAHSLRLSANATEMPKEWNLHELKIYPLRYAPETLISQLRRRGEMLWACRKRCLVSYRQTIEGEQQESDERFMIDFQTFRKLHPNNMSYPMSRAMDAITGDEMEKEDPPDEAFLYLAQPQTKGFNLRTKKWLDLNIDQIHPVAWNRLAFDSLVLDRKTKELITALVSKQISSAKSTDVVAGKGNGLILLLHGGPGTGKTLTAEGVAEIAKKPLYRVTCGDVGTKAEDVEQYLESVLYLGRLWDCVVLLDEAEVFLERRSLDDLQRNALVSVFLRVIEYHEGILVLTSNRVGTFDEAFRSRIQIAVHYPPLRAYQRLQIWKNFFDRLESFKDGAVDVDELRDHLEELQKIEINGRQIRNAITTARQYAEWKEEVMNYDHLTTALQVAQKFNDYSEKLRGGLTDDQIAEEEGIR